MTCAEYCEIKSLTRPDTVDEMRHSDVFISIIVVIAVTVRVSEERNKFQRCRGTEFLSAYPSHTHRKSCGYPHRIPIPTEPQNPAYPYPHPVFSLQEAYFNLLFVTLTVGYYMMYVLYESV